MHRKPQNRNLAYIAITVPWVFIGVMLAFAVLFTQGAIWGEISPAASIVLWIAIAIYSCWLVLSDRNKGYIAAINMHYLKRREEKLSHVQNKTEV